MVVVISMPVKKNNCHLKSLVFSMPFWEFCPSSPKLASLSSIAGHGRRLKYEKENCISPTHCYVHILLNIWCKIHTK